MKKIINCLLSLLPLSAIAQKNYSQLMDQFLTAQMEVNDFSGSVLVMKQNKTVLEKSYGLADREWNVPNTTEGKFRIGSVSKQFTAACIMQLMEKGKLHLNDKLSQFFPGFPNGDSVTIQILLNHTSGVPIFDMQPDFWGFYERLSLSKDSMINYFKNKPYDFSPGKKFRYNDSGYLLLAYILEKATGQSFEEYLRKNILDKLGMNNTGNDRPDSILPLRIRGYDKNKNTSFMSMEWPLGGGSLYSTVEDLYKWDRALYTNSIVSDESKEMIFKPGMGNYGFGWFIDSFFHHYRIHHAGGINGFSANIVRFVNEDVCIIVLSNRDGVGAWTIADGLATILFNHDFELPEHYNLTQVDSMFLEKFVGTYKLSSPVLYMSNIELVRKGNHLFLNAIDIDIPGLSGFEFRPISKNSFGNPDFLLKMEFTVEKSGKVNKAILIDGGAKIEMRKVE